MLGETKHGPEPRLAAEFRQLKLLPQIRAAEVSLDQFAQLASVLSSSPE